MRTLQYSIIALLLLAFAVINQQIGKQLQISHQHQAFNICLTAHSEISGASEAACAKAQDATGTEFLCDKTNAYCWLEVK